VIAGALIAIERRSKRMQALLEEINRRDRQVAVLAGAVAQAWHGGPRRDLHVVTSAPDDLRAIDDSLILHVP
jgi:hypothetical protein